MSTNLPAPDETAAAVSRRLTTRICDEAARKEGGMSFDRFMDMALYEPGLGYYSGAGRKFGPDGDFVTAPEISPLFSRCVAAQVAEVLDRSGGAVLEFGAGSGVLAADMLGELESRAVLPEEYLILEVSAELRHRQRQTLEARVPGLIERVRWLDRLPGQPLSGVVVANEVLDAFPVSRFRLQGGGVEMLTVSCDGGALKASWVPAHADLHEEVARVLQTAALDDGAESEVCLRLGPWIEAVASRLSRGMVLLFDYGYPRRDYYHPGRRHGTLQCHYRHRVHDDPFHLPGLQDITAHVDFTSVADAALDAGLAVAGFTSQTRFLIGCGLDALVTEAHAHGLAEGVSAAQQAKRLVLPSEMGERFKVMGLTRGIDGPWCGFAQPDMRDRL
jgi:SAM-dependent MidA family methyltransferase